MKVLLGVVFSLQLAGANAQLKGSSFVMYINMDRGRWLTFIDDSTCLLETGSLSWGMKSDTIQYTLDQFVVTFSDSGKQLWTDNRTFKLLEIKKRQFQAVRKGYTEGQHYFHELFPEHKRFGSMWVLRMVETTY